MHVFVFFFHNCTLFSCYNINIGIAGRITALCLNYGNVFI